jgi:hypothetical protein
MNKNKNQYCYSDSLHSVLVHDLEYYDKDQQILYQFEKDTESKYYHYTHKKFSWINKKLTEIK